MMMMMMESYRKHISLSGTNIIIYHFKFRILDILYPVECLPAMPIRGINIYFQVLITPLSPIYF